MHKSIRRIPLKSSGSAAMGTRMAHFCLAEAVINSEKLKQLCFAQLNICISVGGFLGIYIVCARQRV